MPKLIGRDAPSATPTVEANATVLPGYTRVTYSQFALAMRQGMDASAGRVALDTTDSGGPRRMAKRWNRWFVPTEAAAKGTDAMRRRAASSAFTR